uniref:F-box protein AT5G49610-like beta-propeller domain-containing protein n=1 Tax=Aegilops tauschii subsp. strangulata TaxID=200361 RepID=A0A452Z4P8_AEGTS
FRRRHHGPTAGADGRARRRFFKVVLLLPPSEPEHLFRAALVCKSWLRVVCDPSFRRRYRAFHGAPPLLGLLQQFQVLQERPAPRFTSTTSMPDFPYPDSDGQGKHPVPLDCRHGRVLIHMVQDERLVFVVSDPVTGDRHVLPAPGIVWLICTAAVFCAADGCQHLDCQGGPFRVAFLATDDDDRIVKASVYSSVTGAWSAPVSLDDGCECYAQHMRDDIAENLHHLPYVMPRRVAVIGDEVYFTLWSAHKIVKYDLPNNCLSMINPPPHTRSPIALMVMEDSSLGFACTESSSLYMWSRKVNSEAAAEWVKCRSIELETIVPVVDPDYQPFVVGSAEGVGVIFINTDAGLFTLELKSGRVRKVDEPAQYFSVLPYMSFYTPGIAARPCFLYIVLHFRYGFCMFAYLVGCEQLVVVKVIYVCYIYIHI